MTITDDLQTCLSRANGGLGRKIQESITLLQKAEHIALKYDADNGKSSTARNRSKFAENDPRR